jgi:tetratricopeptide (TPR) repeat protein
MRPLAALLTLLLAAGCDSKAPPPTARMPVQAPSAPPPPPKEGAREAAERLLARAEQERSSALYDQAIAKFGEAIAADSTDAAAFEGRALARWRLALARGAADPAVAEDLKAAEGRPKAAAIKALVRLVDGARGRGGWDPLPGRILGATLARAFPESGAFPADFGKLCARPEGEIKEIRDALLAVNGWPLAEIVGHALEYKLVSAPGEREGLFRILMAMGKPPAEAAAELESALKECPEQGLLMQAQAQLLAADGKLDEAVRRSVVAPMPLLKAAAHVAAGKHAPALEILEKEADSPFARALRCAAYLQSGKEASLAELDKLVESTPLPWLRFERGVRRLAAGNMEASLEDLRAVALQGGAVSAAWLGFALWHLQEFDGAAAELAKAADLKPGPDLASDLHETLGYILLAKGEVDPGVDRLVKALEVSPTRDLFLRLAGLLRADRRWKGLKALAMVMIPRTPADQAVWTAKAEACFWLKEHEEAAETVGFAMGQGVDPREMLRWRGHALEDLGRFQEAQEAWDRLATLTPHSGEGLAHRAWMKAKLARWEEAKDDAERGISKGIGGWTLAVARFALAAVCAHGAATDENAEDRAAQRESVFEHLRQAVKTGAVEPSDLKAEGSFAPFKDSAEWKEILEASAKKQDELKAEAKKAGSMGLHMDSSGGRVEVTATVRKSAGRKAGIAPGDVILEVDGRRINETSDVVGGMSGRSPGDKVKIRLERELRPGLKMKFERELTLTDRALFDE